MKLAAGCRSEKHIGKCQGCLSGAADSSVGVEYSSRPFSWDCSAIPEGDLYVLNCVAERRKYPWKTSERLFAMYTNARGTLNKENARITVRMKISKSHTNVLSSTGMIVRIVVLVGYLKRRGAKGFEEH